MPVSESADHSPMSQAFWDERYRSSDRVWSGQPNAHLVAETRALVPGRALEVGAGEGADAVWLAGQGWNVTAVDISSVALDRGRAEAQASGAEVADRISWTHLDVLADPLPAGPFDLVSLQFMHFGVADRVPLFERCKDAVSAGGTLLIVAHHPSDLDTTVRRPPMPDAFYAAQEIAEMLDDTWTVVAADARPRQQTDPDGNDVTVHDTVLVAQRP
jgi:SAM-dependent methyltransferase